MKLFDLDRVSDNAAAGAAEDISAVIITVGCKVGGEESALAAAAIALKEEIVSIRLELVALSRLHHPNVVCFRGMILELPTSAADDSAKDSAGAQASVQARPIVGFVFELCPLGSVDDQLNGKSGCGEGVLRTWDARLSVARQAVEGLAYVHAEGFIHRDLNTRNVLLSWIPAAAYSTTTTEGDDSPCQKTQPARLLAQLCDFGAARDLSASGGRLDSDFIEGTPAAMSPEQLCGATLTVLSDVWQASNL